MTIDATCVLELSLSDHAILTGVFMKASNLPNAVSPVLPPTPARLVLFD